MRREAFKNHYLVAMKHSLFICLMCCFVGSVNAQEKPDPYTAVEAFFVAFHARDSVKLKSHFADKAVMYRTGMQKGEPRMQQTSVQRFITAVSTRPEKPTWEERLGTARVEQHQNLAMVWVPFHFYLDGKLLHCGYNSFSLFWNGTAWKILSLVDTATKTCEPLQ